MSEHVRKMKACPHMARKHDYDVRFDSTLLTFTLIYFIKSSNKLSHRTMTINEPIFILLWPLRIQVVSWRWWLLQGLVWTFLLKTPWNPILCSLSGNDGNVAQLKWTYPPIEGYKVGELFLLRGKWPSVSKELMWEHKYLLHTEQFSDNGLLSPRVLEHDSSWTALCPKIFDMWRVLIISKEEINSD